MGKVKRFAFVPDSDGLAGMEEMPKGNWVTWVDYEDLKQEMYAARERCNALQHELDRKVTE